jgi:NAD(P)-dependent dehydrogenase (short-subunit alcohol dehydrogenase family)
MADEQKVVVITGASQGIGASLVKGYRQIGYHVVANSRSIKTRAAFNDPAVLKVEGDIGIPDTADRIVQETMQRFGRIDTLINNAGIFISKPFVEFSEVDVAAITAVNLTGFFNITQRVVSRMLQAGSGHVVNMTSSFVAEQPIAPLPAALTALTKGGLISVTGALAIEYASRGIRVNAVSPGATKTPLNQPQTHEFLAKLHPLRRMAEPEEIVDAVLYLEKAKFVTGEILHVDGGVHAGWA